MNKPYVFLQDSYQDLESLSQAYIANFDEGMQDIYKNTKNLFIFIKSRINDKSQLKVYADILENTRYKSNALTFLIFEMSGHKDIIISGVRLDLLGYLQALRENPDPANNILFGFLEDGGISKTFAKAGADPKLCAHSAAIEKNYRNKFTYDYLTAYYGYETKESLNAKVRNIAINGEECFRRFSNLARSEAFQISLAHIAGFTDTIDAVNDISPVFKSLKLLKGETEEEYLRKIVERAFFWWMLTDDNFNKYEYKGKALKILKKYNEIKRENDKYQNMISAKKISSISFDKYIDMSEELFKNYLSFVAAYHNNLIEVKKKYDPEKYAPDKEYCRTYICQEFMAGKICKLYSPSSKPEAQVNPLTGEPIDKEVTVDLLDDVSNDKAELLVPSEEKEKMPSEKKLKQLRGAYGFFYGSVIVSFLALLSLLVMVLFGKVLSIDSLASLKENYSYLFTGYAIYAAAGAEVLLILVSLLSMKSVGKSILALKRYTHLTENVEVKDFLEEEKILYNEEKKKEEKSAFKSYGFLFFLDEAFLGLVLAVLAFFAVATVTALSPSLGNFQDMVYGFGVYVPFVVALLMGMVFGILFGNKSKVKLVIFTVLTVCVSSLVLFML